jgi:hypothetical protein
MTEHRQLTEEQVEILKRKYGIDERIAEKYDIPMGRVEKDFDPRIVKLILAFLDRNS